MNAIKEIGTRMFPCGSPKYIDKYLLYSPWNCALDAK